MKLKFLCMNDIFNSFRLSRLADTSAWSRLVSRQMYFLLGFGLICAAGFVNLVFLVYGVVFLVVFAIGVICCADSYVEIDNRRYYIYKNNDYLRPYTIVEEEDWPKHRYDDIYVKQWEIVSISCGQKCLLYQDEKDCWYLIAEDEKMSQGYKRRLLGKRLAKSFFIEEVDDDAVGEGIDSIKILTVFCENEKIRRCLVRDVFVGENIKPFFTDNELNTLSDEELSADYVLAKTSSDYADLWKAPGSAESLFSARKMKILPIEHFLLRDGNDVKLCSRSSRGYSFRSYPGYTAINLSGRFFKPLSLGHVALFEIDKSSGSLVEIYRGLISSMDFDTGEFS